MKYPDIARNIVDITKAPYYADNTGHTDCTEILCRAIDDSLRGYIDRLTAMREELLALYKEQGENVYLGSESGRVVDGEVYVTLPKELPPSKILYFPNGTYLIGDTLSYTFDRLCTQQSEAYVCELCRNIHILGECKEKTVIRLGDYSEGFEKGQCKPVVCFNRKSEEEKETTNCGQLNTLEDITIDCGKGNEGAIGVLYASSNVGRIENVCIKADGGKYGIVFDYGSEGCVTDVEITGFDYGIKTNHTSPLVFDNLILSGNKIAGVLSKNGNLNFQKVESGAIPTLRLSAGGNGRFYFAEPTATVVGETEGNFVTYRKENALLDKKRIPKSDRSKNHEDWACIDDFGAVGDGKTDCTLAIQKAMDSGKSVVLFGEGKYLINRTIKVPASVHTLDLMYASIVPGYSLLIGEMESVFDICEDGDETFFAEHFFPDEIFSGFFRMFKHSSKRTVVIKDMNISAPLYFNTTVGSEVYFDNCFTHTNHYSQNCCIARAGYVPVFCRMIPVELHGQKAYASNLNIERADLELLNDGGDLIIDGYKAEGPGMLVKTANGGKTQLNLFNAAWWGNKIPGNGLFEVIDSEIDVAGGNVFCYPKEENYCLTVNVKNDGKEEKTTLRQCSKKLDGVDALGRDLGRLIENIAVRNGV